ncbi:PoNe immunity protein domain-containing protein [Uliginosibacterium sp. TH139]|uniref:PoNe immunity protein domain-containing protein n=1 Tax=Uliginosibacterium sp. TH139 TaxID=2067453 RepID=UPI000C7CB244|nr:PoNe immunity protein domain-containing protein [Uliginosibacterium sp. TH139]PLK50141.1 hypothetical protein C0V76_06975 [Uliginosibacterium sp. TH139]
MDFRQIRRQQFLTEDRYVAAKKRLPEEIAYFALNPVGSGASEAESEMLARLLSAEQRYDLLSLRYTGGEPIELLREELEEVVLAYERYGEQLWRYRSNRNEFVFDPQNIDEYCQLLQLVGLCFLLHRRDLLKRISVLQDGEDGANGGADNLYEELMSHGLGADSRYESDWISAAEPYQALSDALYSETNDEAIQHLHHFLQRWYKDLAGTAWHDSHKPDDAGRQGGYYGYWSFEAGAAVLLLGIEDDSSLHQYLYYPKDLVAWARANSVLSEDITGTNKVIFLRCPGGDPCPKSGYWSTPAKVNSRRQFKQGETMPNFESSYGATIWQCDIAQS